MSDHDLLQRVVDRHVQNEDENFGPVLTARAIAAFRSMLKQQALSAAQRAWLYDAAEKLGVMTTAPCANVFSSLPEKAQKEHAERARNVALPWEQPGYKKILKPPR